MDFVIDFVMRTAGYFILSYFIFQIIGRKHNYLHIMYIVFIVIEMADVISAVMQNVNLALLLFTLRVLPLLLSWYLFLRFTDGLKFKLISRQKKLKGIKHEIIPSKRIKTGSIYMMIGSIPLFLVGYFFMEGIMTYVIYACSLLSLVGGIYLYLKQNRIKSESVIIFIGRDKEHIYTYEISKDSYKVEPKDFFFNEDYIIDPIGQVQLIEYDQSISTQYLYWVATTAKVDLKDSPLQKIDSLPYLNDLDHFEKYHYKKISYKMLKTGALEKISEKLIK